MSNKLELEIVRSKRFTEIEAYKKFRSNLQFCGKDIKVISFTSSLQDEGKTQVSFNLCVSLAEMGKKVLFVDSDLRNSSFTRDRKVTIETIGLAHYLIGEKTAEEIIYETQMENLYVVTAGTFPPNPSELLSIDLYKDFIEYARGRFDYVIVDNAPLGLVIDCAITASCSDGVVMVIEQGRISRTLAKSVVEQLKKSDCKILGIVVNKTSTNDGGRGYGYGYGYYGYPYGSDKPADNRTRQPIAKKGREAKTEERSGADKSKKAKK